MFRKGLELRKDLSLRFGILTETVDALRDAQYEPVLAGNRAAIETPFASSWKGAAKPEVTLVDVLLPTRSGVMIRKRCISRPTEHQAILLQRLGLELPSSLEMARV